MKVTKGILWQNESIVCILIGSSKNRKTGGMVQSFILVKDVDPITANRTGLDSLICGQCPHRGTPNDNGKGLATGRTCYVNIGQGVSQVWKAYRRGSYPVLTRSQALAIVQGKGLRIGTYGDGAFVPDSVWEPLIKSASHVTAYTHQGIQQNSVYMQSAETLDQARKVWESGKRTFRVIPLVSDIDRKNEVICPASKEAGNKTTCTECKLCNGNAKAKSVAIVAHGIGGLVFKKNNKGEFA